MTANKQPKHTETAIERPKAAQRPYREIEAEALDRVIGVVQILREVSPNMSLNQVLTFLEIVKKDGIGMMEVREKVGVVQQVFSNIVAALSPTSYQKKNGKPVDGYGLVLSTDSYEDGRAKHLNLTGKGKKVSEKIISKIKGLVA